MTRNRIAAIAAFTLLSLLVAACAAPASAPAPTGTYVDVTAAEAKALIDQNPNLVVLDVSPVYSLGHLPRAVNYPVGDGSLDKAIPTLDKNAEYLVYCHSDGPAISGAQKLVDAGFKAVYRLEGNYAAWVDAGYPVES